MQLGIFAKTFPRPTLEETLDAVVAHGLTHIQFNMSCVGLPTLPDRIDESLCVRIARALAERGLTMAAISGTFNMCDPDESRLEDNLRRLEVLAASCRWLDTRIITLCTGTFDPHDMWTWHSDNVRKSTWERLVYVMKKAVKIADRHEVTLAFEPEIRNVVASAMRARRLLDEIASPWLKVVIDPANLVHSGDHRKLQEVLDEAFDWLGPDIVLAHAKDPPSSIGETPGLGPGAIESLIRTTIGRGCPEIAPVMLARLASEAGAPERWQSFLRWPFYHAHINCLKKIGYGGALIMHGFGEGKVAVATWLLRALLESTAEPMS
jgi:sugar phosphate isomerase/epimerase